MDRLDGLHVDYMVSPLHDKDVNADGTPKKPHYHVVIQFDCVKSGAQVAPMMWDFGAVVSPNPNEFFVASLRGIGRYLCHLDNPEKFQYDQADVKSKGIEYEDLIRSKNADKLIEREIMDFILDNDNIKNWYEFLEWARKYHVDWYELACSKALGQLQNALYWKWKSRRQNIRDEYWTRIGMDPETAEALGYQPGMFLNNDNEE